MKRIAYIVAISLLAACQAPEPPLPYISDKAMAALPKGTDLRTVKRRDDGCYLIVIDDDMSGVIRPVKGPDGQIICDII